MGSSLPRQMKAAAIDHFGGPEVIHVTSLPLPKPGAHEILIQVDAAGIGVWDPSIRAGEFELGATTFPKVIGNDGAGTVVEVGAKAKRFQVGSRVYAYSMEGGFYAEYVAVSEDNAAAMPPSMSALEAGALGADGVTALLGLDDQLKIAAGQRLMIFGASGGIGHLAVQLAKRMGAQVFAIASGRDGVDLVKRLGADAAVDGHKEDVVRAARQFAPEGFDAALVLTSAEGVDDALALVKGGGRAAYPNGVEPAPKTPAGVSLSGYDGIPDADALARLNRLIGSAPFHVELGHVYGLSEAATAHRELARHHLGKLAFKVRSS